MNLPDPPVPLDTDVSQMPGFILDVDQLLLSNLWLLSSGDAFKAALGLWCRAWKEIPAGSLPDDDPLLAAFSCAGVNWPKVREMALRNFIKCSDVRLYHTKLCKDALRASDKQRQFTNRTKAATEARKLKRLDHGDGEREEPRNDERNVHPPPPSPPITDSGDDVTRERVREVTDKVLSLIPRGHDTPGLVGGGWAIVEVWLKGGAHPERDIYPAVQQLIKREPRPSSLSYFTKAIARATKTRQGAGQSFNSTASAKLKATPKPDMASRQLPS